MFQVIRSVSFLYRFVTCSLRFMDAYHKKLNGRQAAWAAKRYRGHHMVSEAILPEVEEANIL